MIFEPSDYDYRLKWVFSSFQNGAWGDEPDGETDVACIRAADFDGILGRLRNGERTLRSIEPQTFEKLALHSGDIIIEKSGGGEKQPVGRAVLFNEEESSITSNFLARCRPAPLMEPAFINYLLLALYNARGTVPHLKQSTGIQNLDLASFLDIRVSIPHIDTQRRIARFLDEKTSQIDALIDKKRELLNRLAEKRQALITRAVTKGLNSDISMKPSGIDWLGETPAHWSLVPFKWRCQIQSGQVDPMEADYTDMILIAPDHIESGTGRLVETASAGEQGAISGKYLCPEDSVLYSKIRPALRKVALNDGQCLCSADMYAIDPGRDLVRKYLFYFLLTDAFTSYAELESLRVAMPKVNREALGAFPVPVPSLEEQGEIARFCEGVDQDYSNATDKIRDSIAILNEYRSAQIAVAVTGQFKEFR